MEASILHQQSLAHAFLQIHDAKSDVCKLHHLYQHMPVTPIYSRPGSSCSQPPTLYSNGNLKPSMMLETDIYDSHFPPSPLSTSGSAMGSPKTADALQTRMNPMFSGLDGFGKDIYHSVETCVVDWSTCASPPMTPAYMASQPPLLQQQSSTDMVSMTTCPSLSPSPTSPYARSITSEQDVDFCDPRNLTVSVGNNPTLAPEFNPGNLGDADAKGQEAPSSTFDFNPAAMSNGLPAFQDLDDLDCDDDFTNLVVVGLDATATSRTETRPRACTASSVVSLGHYTFDDELDFDDHDALSFFSSPDTKASPPCSPDNNDHRDKKQKKSHKLDDGKLTLEIETASTVSDLTESSSSSSPCHDNTSPVSAAPSRRGRKQSLTEDPSKTFVCDLCNRRFRRQEHLKRHYRSLHTQEKPFECHECGKKFSRSDNLAQHARTHSGGAIVMDLIDDHGSQGLDSSSRLSTVSGELSYGKVMFHVGSKLVGDVLEASEEESDDKKKRKRCD